MVEELFVGGAEIALAFVTGACDDTVFWAAATAEVEVPADETVVVEVSFLA